MLHLGNDSSAVLLLQLRVVIFLFYRVVYSEIR